MYPVGSFIVCQIEQRPSGYKYVLSREPNPASILTEDRFEIIAIDNGRYVILLPEHLNGYVVSKFHIQHYNYPARFENQKFWDVTEEFILEEETRVVNNRLNRIKKSYGK